MELMEAIKERRSARKYFNKEIPEFIIEEMLEAARLAPSGGNSQNRIFGIITNLELKKQLAEAAGNQMWIATAPVVIACCVDISWDLAAAPPDDFGRIVNILRFGHPFIKYLDQYPDRKAVRTLFENASPLIPAEHMLLVAASHGLSGCFIGYLDIAKANEVLELPPNLSCLFLIPVGYSDDSSEQPQKKELSEICFYRK